MCHICQIFGCILRSSLPTASSLTHAKKVQVVLLGSKSKEGENDDNLNPNTYHTVKRYNSARLLMPPYHKIPSRAPLCGFARTSQTQERMEASLLTHTHLLFCRRESPFYPSFHDPYSFARTSLTLHAPHIPFLITIDILDREKQQGASCSCCVGGGLSNANVRRNNLTALLDDDPQHQQRRISRKGACRCLLLYS